MNTFGTIEHAAGIVGLEPHDLRERLDRVPEVVAAGFKIARRGADLVEIAAVARLGRE